MLWGYIKKHTTKIVKDKDLSKVRVKAYGPARGILIGVADDQKFTIGYSLVNAKHDRFDEAHGKKLAEGRAKSLLLKGSIDKIKPGLTVSTLPVLLIPASIQTQVNKFIARAQKYFPGKEQGFRVETLESQMSAQDAAKLSRIFGGEPKPAVELDKRFIPAGLGVPNGLNEFFLQAGGDTLLIRKNNRKWEVVTV